MLGHSQEISDLDVYCGCTTINMTFSHNFISVDVHNTTINMTFSQKFINFQEGVTFKHQSS